MIAPTPKRTWRLMAGLLAVCLLLATPPLAAEGHSARTPQVTLSLLAERDRATPGETLWLALRFELIPHWHVYWRNPGDSGEPPRVNWELPAGWRAGDVHWPLPERIRVGPLVNYGYEGTVDLLVPVAVPADAEPSGAASIAAEVTWLVCREECIPQSARLALRLPAAAVAPPGAFAAARARWPVTLPTTAAYRPTADALELRVGPLDWPAEQLVEAWFAPHAWGPVAPSQPQDWRFANGNLVLDLPTGEAPLAADAPLDGLLVIGERLGDDTLVRGFSLTATPAGAPATARPDSGIGLWLALGLALLGGLLLNLMPCVLPVLSIKALGLIRHADGQGARHGLAFAAGTLITLLGLAALLIGLRAGGAALGWGFQLQEPWVIAALMYLMLALGLNLSGVYSIGAGVTGFGQSLTERGGLRGTFATGVLAVVVASPCTAPFMGTALGFALTRPAIETLLVFAALGVGFALPLLLLSLWPGWVRLLPAPGPWMERLRNALAFPLYATAAWLLWVLSQQVGEAALAGALAGSVLLAGGLWWLGQPLRRRRLRNVVAGTLLAASLGMLGLAGHGAGPADPAVPATAWSPERVTALRASGRPVLVNFTAAWCITCKVNERVALDTAAVRAAMRRHDVAYLEGDWTRRDPAIARELERHGRSGVPLVLLYPAGQSAPVVLPQILTEGLVIRTLAQTP